MTDDMYQKVYWDAQEVLDKILGPNEEDGAGEGLVAEIRLVGAQRDEARELLKAAQRILDTVSTMEVVQNADEDLAAEADKLSQRITEAVAADA